MNKPKLIIENRFQQVYQVGSRRYSVVDMLEMDSPPELGRVAGTEMQNAWRQVLYQEVPLPFHVVCAEEGDGPYIPVGQFKSGEEALQAIIEHARENA